MSTLRLTISKDGVIRSVYSDALLPLLRQGKFTRARASHVEPDDTDGTWYADMSPVNGPKLTGYESREAALKAELEWLTAHNTPLPKELE